jgi:hypothetical protein
VFVKFMMVSALFYFFLFTKAEICFLPHETHFSDVWYKRSWVLMVPPLLPYDNDLLCLNVLELHNLWNFLLLVNLLSHRQTLLQRCDGMIIRS